MKAIKNYRLIDNFTNKLINFPKNTFCYKFIPYSNLKFEEINFYEPVCKIYEIENKIGGKNIKVISIFMYLYLIFNPLKMNFMYPAIGNIILQPYLLLKYYRNRKNNSHNIKTIFLLKNGQQILIKTFDNSVHLIYIADLKDFTDINKYGVAILRTDDKEFYLNINSKNVKTLNDDILSAIKDGMNINTSGSYSNYHRLLKPK